MNLDDTIVAIATPPGCGGIGVVRISGPEARNIALPMLRLKHDLEPGRAVLGELVEPWGAGAFARSEAESNPEDAVPNKTERAGAFAPPSTRQRIDEVVDISPYVEIKREAIRAHRSQCAEIDLDQAILGLNRYRGEMHSWPGGDYAEVFARLIV